jgi:3-keto-disaccharide hydrolase
MTSDYKRKLIYNFDLKSSIDDIETALERWRFIGSSSTQPIARVENSTIVIGTVDQSTFNYPLTDEIANCSVECDLRIIDDGGDTSHWAGVRVRGFLNDIRFGYLVYLRSSGIVQLYRAEQVIGESAQVVTADTKNTWTKLRVDIFDYTIKIWANERLVIDATDRKFTAEGLVYLHTFGTQAEFRQFSIYELSHRFASHPHGETV